MLAAGWVIIGKWYFNALAAVLIAFLIARLLRLDLFQVCVPPPIVVVTAAIVLGFGGTWLERGHQCMQKAACSGAGPRSMMYRRIATDLYQAERML